MRQVQDPLPQDLALYFIDALGVLRATELSALNADDPDPGQFPYGSVVLPRSDAKGNAVLIFIHPGASERRDVLVMDKPADCSVYARKLEEARDPRPGRELRSRVRIPMDQLVRDNCELPSSVAVVRLCVGAESGKPLENRVLRLLADLRYTIRIGDQPGWFEFGEDAFPNPAFRHGFPDIATKDQGSAGIRGPSIIAASLQRSVESSGFIPQRKMPLRPGERVICEIHIGTFTSEGTFAAASTRLAYLLQKGFTTLQLMPIDISSGPPGWTYDQARTGAVNAEYGGAEGLMDFVLKAHEMSLEVIVDKQYNHRGPEQDSRPQIIPGMFERQTIWGPGLSGRETRHYPQIIRLLGEEMAWWVWRFGIDGFRFDATNRLPWEVHQELAAYGRRIGELMGKPLYLLSEYAECEEPKGLRVPTGCQYTDQTGRYLMKMFGLSRALHVAELMADKGSILRPMLTAARRGWWYPDMPPPEIALGGDERACAMLWHHDWIGNRFNGERISSLLSFSLYKVLAVWQALGQWTPILFMGTERYARTPWFFFTGHKDEAARNHTSAFYEQENGRPVLKGGRFYEFRPEAKDAGLREAITFSSDSMIAGIQWDSFRSQFDRLGRPYMDHARRETFEASKLVWDQDQRGAAIERLFEVLLPARRDPRLYDHDPSNSQYKGWERNERVFLLRRRSPEMREFIACFNLGDQTEVLQFTPSGIGLPGANLDYIVSHGEGRSEEEWGCTGTYTLWLDTNDNRFGGSRNRPADCFTIVEGFSRDLEIPPESACVFARD